MFYSLFVIVILHYNVFLREEIQIQPLVAFYLTTRFFFIMTVGYTGIIAFYG